MKTIPIPLFTHKHVHEYGFSPCNNTPTSLRLPSHTWLLFRITVVIFFHKQKPHPPPLPSHNFPAHNSQCMLKVSRSVYSFTCPYGSSGHSDDTPRQEKRSEKKQKSRAHLYTDSTIDYTQHTVMKIKGGARTA